MSVFSSILFSPLCGDGKNVGFATRRVADLASKTEARLLFFGAAPKPSKFQRALIPSGIYEVVREALRNSISENVFRWSSEVEYPNSEVAVEEGDIAELIVERVEAEGHDLVAVAGSSDDEDRRTIKRLIRMCPCPVWVIRRSSARVQRVLAAIDADPSELELNREILELASTMAGLHGGELYVVHAWELFGERAMRSSPQLRIAPAEIDSMLKVEQDRRRDAIVDALDAAGVRDAPWSVILEKGRPSDVIREAVDQRRINLLVMGTVARTGVSGLVIGNTAEKVLDMVQSSVMTVKPPGFPQL